MEERITRSEWGHPIQKHAGTVLFRPGDICSGFIIMRSGVARVSLIADTGREIILYRVHPGDVCLQTFSCLVHGRHYTAQGIAETDIEAEIVSIADFTVLLAGDATFRAHFFDAVARRFNDLEQLIEDFILTDFQTRLARVLLRLVDNAQFVTATHEVLAVEAGSGRAAITRQLGRFAREGLVALERGRIKIVDRPGLETVATTIGD